MIFVRFLMPLALVLGLVAYLLLPWTDGLFLRWSETDLQMRSKLVFSSIQDDLPDIFTDRADRLTRRFTQLAEDERLIGIGYCESTGTPTYRNKNFPDDISCPDISRITKPKFTMKTIKGGPVMVATFPVANAPPAGGSAVHAGLIIVHDMSFAEHRSEQTRRYVLWVVFGISLLAALITLIVARITLSRWVLELRDYIRTGKRGPGLPREVLGLTSDIQQRIRQIEREQPRPLLTGPQWSAATLFEFVRSHLPSEQLIAVSFRQPYAHYKTGDGIAWSTPASGLVTAIEPIMKACRGTWIAVATSETDRIVADDQGAIMVPPDDPSYRLKRLWISEAEEAGFYAGCANEGIWPLCNMAYIKPRFRASDWEMYQTVNRKFASAVVAESKSDAPIVFIQDYHFGLLPKLIREKLPNALIICFWHIPWPNSETFGILPWRSEFLDGMLAADIVGFHTQLLCNNFLDSVDTYVEALIDRERNTVKRGQDFCMVRPYPISIAWPDFDALGVSSLATCREQLVAQLKIDPSIKIILGVAGLDYIKGIPERLRAFSIFLERHPDWRGKVCFVQVAAPSRSIIPAYADIDRQIDDIVAEVNQKFGTETWTPVHLLKRGFSQPEVYRFYRAADVCVVSSLHEGMNLVAKEFIAARDDKHGVLILSQFAGSSHELVDAIIVNPYDEEGMANSILRSLTMNEDEQMARMESMRNHVNSHNIFAWAAEILGDAAKLHRRRQLNSLLQQMHAAPYESAVPDETAQENIIAWPALPKTISKS
ncbi:alpha,alpha-trehalose-phosphate synthase (UDP-forming) [Methyloferula stellata]|uniref:alpha,alpha-trehalose-phosphate synthase (UDP-forming) n=1 Tax=Methyloferula stellata TaxID=876270 RepID=UPI000370ADB2|nr:trehalose-6-phosphate synthase [Methyloferula stellata]